MKSTPVIVFLMLALASAAKAQRMSIGLRTGTTMWEGTGSTGEFRAGEMSSTNPTWDKEIFWRKMLAERWIMEVSLGHSRYKDSYEFGSIPEFMSTQGNAYSLGLSFDYNIGTPRMRSVGKSTLMGGWEFAVHYSETEKFITWDYKGVAHAEYNEWNEENWFSGPRLVFNQSLSSRLSVLCKALYLINVSSVVYRIRGEHIYRGNVITAISLSAGLCYSFR